MCRRNGRGEAYLYHMDQPDKYGESLPFPDDFRFPLGEPFQIVLRVAMKRWNFTFLMVDYNVKLL